MKVLFYSYPSAFQNPGGGEIQLLKTKEFLIKRGVEVKLFNQWEDKFKDFDIFHVFGSVKDCVGIMQTARNIDIKVVLSPIFWSNFNRAMHENNSILSRINLTMRHSTKLILPFFPSGRRKSMVLSDMLLPNSNLEKEQIRRLFAIPGDKLQVVYNGVDDRFREAKAEEFINKFGYKNFILAVGRIEPRKNQLSLIKASKYIDNKIIIIGDPVSDYLDYYKLCRQTAGKNVHFLNSIAHEDSLLASAYAACSVFVAPGWFETPGLAALEAALAGAKLSVTKFGSTVEYFADMAEYFNPANTAQIAKAIKSSLEKNKNTGLQEHVYKNYTWDKIAEATNNAYEKLLQ